MALPWLREWLERFPDSPDSAMVHLDRSANAIALGPDLFEEARRAFEAAAADVVRIAERLRTEGRLPEAEIVETGALMAADPTLDREVSRLVLVEGRPAADPGA